MIAAGRILAAGLVLGATVTSAVAQPSSPIGGLTPAWGPPPSGHQTIERRHEHDSLMIQLQAGPAALRFTGAGGQLEFEGRGLAIHAAVGSSVAPGLIVHLELARTMSYQAALRTGGVITDDDVTLGTIAVGAGLTWYLMPANVYLAGSISMMQLGVQPHEGAAGHTDYGPSLALALGKEWWMSPSWGVGLAARATYGALPAADGPFEGGAAALVVSATYD